MTIDWEFLSIYSIFYHGESKEKVEISKSLLIFGVNFLFNWFYFSFRMLIYYLISFRFIFV